MLYESIISKVTFQWQPKVQKH